MVLEKDARRLGSKLGFAVSVKRCVNMCGIAGIISFADKPCKGRAYRRALSAAIRSMENRGTDAAGLWLNDHETGKFALIKTDCKASELARTEHWAMAVHQDFSTAFAHTRFATQGSPKDNANNHPIRSKRTGCVLVHNGCISNDAELARELGFARDGLVDSEAILRTYEVLKACMKKGKLAAIKATIKKLRGSAAFALQDGSTVFLYRGDNPCWTAWISGRNCMIFASEKFQARAAADHLKLRSQERRDWSQVEYREMAGCELLKFHPTKKKII